MTLKTLYNHFASNKESSWIMKPYNAEALYKFIKEHPIKKVLELGTGIGLSAAVVALALEDKGEVDYKIDTIEQYDKCILLAKQLIPVELQKNITIHKANPEIWTTEYIPHQDFSVYDLLPDEEYDLIINDGPSPFMENGHYVDLPNGSVLAMLLNKKIMKTGTFVAYDGRFQSLGLVERFFSENFFIVPAKNNDLNILERKDNEPFFLDVKLESMVAANYFKDEKENLSPNNSETPSSPTTPSDPTPQE